MSLLGGVAGLSGSIEGTDYSGVWPHAVDQMYFCCISATKKLVQPYSFAF